MLRSEVRKAPIGRWSRPSSGQVAVCNVRALGVSIGIEFSDAEALDVTSVLLGVAPPPIRMPPFVMSGEATERVLASIRLRVQRLGETLRVQFDGAVRSPTYEVEARRFHLDFWKVVFASVVATVAESSGAIAFHAAAAVVAGGAHLIAGPSGSGKSAIATALGSGRSLLSTELAFTRAGEFAAGNVNSDETSRLPDGRFVPDHDPPAVLGADVGGEGIISVVTPVARDQPLVIRELSAPRLRAVLFENAIAMTGIAAMLGHETLPMALRPSDRHLDAIASEVSLLAERPGAVWIGRPHEIARQLRS